ncbi:MAG: glutamate 5-kinase [Elusimicrobiota bacterium]
MSEKSVTMPYKRIVVKIGTHLITAEDGRINRAQLNRLIKELSVIFQQGKELLIVTSGAVASGVNGLKLTGKPQTLPLKQAAAAIGQVELMRYYQESFAQAKITVGQILLTRQDMDDRQRYLNARNTLFTLLEHRVIPIINENDTVAVEEIKFGDNDTLSALVAGKVEADLLVLLTDVDGLCLTNPREDRQARIIPFIEKITPEIEKMASKGTGSRFSTGGMHSKIQAAKIATVSGVTMVIANGQKPAVLKNIIEGKPVGTKFLAVKQPLESRKRWIAFGARKHGQILVDAGAARALVSQGKSLLPAGITGVEGNFAAGEMVVVCSPEKEIARGLSFYSSEQLKKIIGRKTSEIKKILNTEYYDEVIHRDNLVIL